MLTRQTANAETTRTTPQHPRPEPPHRDHRHDDENIPIVADGSDRVEHVVDERLAVPFEFQLELDVAECQHLRQLRNLLTGVRSAEPGVCIERTQLLDSCSKHRTVPVRGPFERQIIDDHQLAVTGGLDIELDAICSEIDRASKRRHRVLRADRRSTSSCVGLVHAFGTPRTCDPGAICMRHRPAFTGGTGRPVVVGARPRRRRRVSGLSIW